MKNALLIAFLLIWSFSALTQNRFGPPKTQSGLNTDNTGIDYTAPREYEIAQITVSGAKFLDPNALVSLSGLSIGQKVTLPGPVIGSAVKKLWKQGIVGDIEISITKTEGDKVYLNIALKERPKLSRFVFRGVRKGEVETLKDKIDVILGKAVSESLIKNAQNTLQKYYADKGFLNCRATMVMKTDTVISNSVLLQINVNKGSRVKIENLAFEGNEVFSDKKLAKKLKKTKQKKFTHLFTPSKFIKAKYEEDKQNLIKFYNSQGYRDARILEDTVYSVNKKRINVRLTMDEGRKYYYKNITWSGNYIYTGEQLSNILGIKKGEVYDLEKLEKKLNFSQTELDITSLYMDDGYLFFRVEPVEVAVDGDSVDIEIRITEGSQANINRIILNGNTKTSDKVVLREIRTTPGQKFSRSDLIRSQREISNLGYFDPEKIQINPQPNIEDGTVDIEYVVEEKPSDQIELSGGWGGFIGFVGTLGVVFNNFSIRKLFKFKEWGGILPSGDGQRLAVRFQANGTQFQTYTLTFTEPWLGGRKPNSFTVNFSHSVNRIRNPFQVREFLGKLSVTSVSVGLGRRLTWPDDFFTLSNTISLTRYVGDRFPSLAIIFPPDGTGVSNSITFNTTFARNSIDNPTFPRRGSNISLSLNLTPPYSLFDRRRLNPENQNDKFKLIEYYKIMFDNSWFTNLFGKFVLNARAHFGMIGSYTGQGNIPPFERFVLGGDGLTQGLAGANFLLGTEIIGLRGYQNNSIVPQASQAGGVIYNKYVLDVRYPVSLNPAATIFVLAFAEAGNNFGRYEEYSPFDLKRSVGVGARIFMPAFGLLGLDWGYGFDSVPGVTNGQPSKGRFHFTIGQQFR